MPHASIDASALPHDHGKISRQLRENLPDDATVTGVAEAMKQLGDPTRLKIFWILCHCEECVINIAAMMGMTSPAVSHHLRLLKAGGLIVARREGREMYYRASEDTMVQFFHHMVEEIARISCPA